VRPTRIDQLPDFEPCQASILFYGAIHGIVVLEMLVASGSTGWSAVGWAMHDLALVICKGERRPR
jgi:hypothetical protein